MGNPTWIAITASIFLLVAHQAYTFAGRSNGGKRALTSEEQILANEARQEIAQVLEKNLIKFFTLVAADSGNGRGGFGRQEEDDDDVPTLNPNTLPQVAQILGAIFAGNLNLTAIADRTFSLVPDVIRNQVDGLFKLLTGKPAATTTTTAKPTSPKKRRRTTSKTKATSPMTDYDVEQVTEPSTTEPPTTIKSSAAGVPAKTRYRLSRNRTTPAPSLNAIFTEDDELYRLEGEMISAAIDSEPYIRNKEPRFFVQPVREILTNLDNGRLNLTQIIKFLPDLFQGARHAFTLLENLGQIAGVDLDEEVDDN